MQPSPQLPVLPLHHTVILRRPARLRTRRQTLNHRIRVRRHEIWDRIAGPRPVTGSIAIAIAIAVSVVRDLERRQRDAVERRVECICPGRSARVGMKGPERGVGDAPLLQFRTSVPGTGVAGTKAPGRCAFSTSRPPVSSCRSIVKELCADCQSLRAKTSFPLCPFSPLLFLHPLSAAPEPYQCTSPLRKEKPQTSSRNAPAYVPRSQPAHPLHARVGNAASAAGYSARNAGAATPPSPRRRA